MQGFGPRVGIDTSWRNVWSVEFGGRRLKDDRRGLIQTVVHNDFHHPRRQNSDIAHELAHIVLGHPLTAPIKANGERYYVPAVEEEARWLGATLLLPKKALIYITLNGLTIETVQDEYGVSASLFRFRVQVTDAYQAAKNTRRKYGTAAE